MSIKEAPPLLISPSRGRHVHSKQHPTAHATGNEFNMSSHIHCGITKYPEDAMQDNSSNMIHGSFALTQIDPSSFSSVHVLAGWSGVPL